MRQFPLYEQHDSMLCGITCLRMVCKHFGVSYSAEFLSSLCIEGREGISLLALSKGSTRIGLKNECGLVGITEIQNILPCILHWKQNHFVVLYKVKKNRFYIADPAKGLVKYNLEEFKKHWVSTQSGGEEKGIAMFLEPTPAFYEKKMDEQPTEERSFKFLFGYIKQYRKYFGQIVLGCSWEVFCNSFFEVGRPTERWT